MNVLFCNVYVLKKSSFKKEIDEYIFIRLFLVSFLSGNVKFTKIRRPKHFYCPRTY